MPSSSRESIEDVSTLQNLSEIEACRYAPNLANEVGIALQTTKTEQTVVHETEIQCAVLPVTDLGQAIVGWDSQDDPNMPRNFRPKRKMALMLIVSAISLMTSLSSSMLAPAIENIQTDFRVSSLTVASMPVTIYLLGYAIGPLFLAPMSEIYGRAPVITSSNVFFCLCHIGNALSKNLGALIVSRFLSGIGGSASLTLAGALVADLYQVRDRGVAMSIFAIGPTIGPAIGPIIGALTAQSIGWHWDGWIVCIPSTIITLAIAIFLPETNHEVLISRKVDKLRRESNRPELQSCYATSMSSDSQLKTFLTTAILRPCKILLFAPMVTIPSIYIAFLYGTMYVMYNTIPMVFADQYGWSLGSTGLVYIAIALGDALGIALFAWRSDRAVVSQTKANGGVFEPEMRLPSVIQYCLLVSASFFWYGWTAEKQAHWVVPVISLVLFGFGILGVWAPLQMYLVDAYPAYAASSMAGFTVLRSIMGAFLPMAGTTMFEKSGLGLGWGNSVLGFICLALTPVPYFLYHYGKKIRTKHPLKLT